MIQHVLIPARPSVLGQSIRHLRQASGWTVPELARLSGVDIDVIRQLERGLQQDTSSENIARLARQFCVTPASLVAEENSTP